MMNKTKPYKLGTYQIGWRMVDVWISPLTYGGSFVRTPERGAHARMTIGLAYRCFEDAWMVVHHEGLELIMADDHVRFRNAAEYVEGASDTYIFNFNHNQFTEIAGKMAWFSAGIMDDFKKAWAFHTKKKGKR